MADDPAPCVLAAHTFEHQELGEHVDEIRFTEFVLITGCEILDYRAASSCSALPLLGETRPSSFALELFVRIRGEARFRAVCPAFVYSSTASVSLEPEVSVTDHMVLRGIYSAVTVVVYGNPVKELKLSYVPFPLENAYEEHQPPNLNTLTPGRCEEMTEVVSLVSRLLRLSTKTNAACESLIAAALAFRNIDRGAGGGEQEKTISAVVRANKEVEESLERDQNFEIDAGESLEIALGWIQNGLQSTTKPSRILDPVNTFLAGLAAVQLLCLDTSFCLDFVVAGGIPLLIRVLENSSVESMITKAFALQALECSSRHGFACEALLGWSKQERRSGGYAVLLLTLLEAKRPSIINLSHKLLHRLRVYELAGVFQATVDSLLGDELNAEKCLIQATSTLRKLTKLWEGVTCAKRFMVLEFEDDVSKSDDKDDDRDECLLILLQERRLVSSIAALLSCPHLRNEQSKALMNVYFELMGTVQEFLVSLLSSQSGILLLATEIEATSAVISVMCGFVPSQGEAKISLKQAAVLVGKGYACHPRDIGRLLQTNLSVVNKFNCLIASACGSEESLCCLWELLNLSRTQTGREAILIILQIPEVLSAVMKVLDTAAASISLPNEKLVAASHYAAEILFVLLSDTNLSVWRSWIFQAKRLQDLFLSLKNAEDDIAEKGLLVSRLQLLADVGVLYQSRGPIGLLKYSASIVGGNANIETLETGSNGLDVNVFKGQGPSSGVSEFGDSTIMQLSACMQILASVCSHSIAAALIGEGAVTFICSLLEHSASILQVNELDEYVSDDLGEQSKVKLTVNLLIPSLILLSSLLQRIQLEGQQYRNTKLVDVLLRLHRAISSKSAAHTTAPPFSWEAGGLELAAVLQLLASVLAYWPVFGWGPDIIPKLFGCHHDNSVTVPMDPIETCSSLVLLGDLLPLENSSLCMDKCSIYRNYSLETAIGRTTIHQVRWHTETPFRDMLLEALTSRVQQFSDLVLRLASSTCAMLRKILKVIIVRLSCENACYAASLLRPLLNYVQEKSSATTLLSDIDVLCVLCCMKFISELALHSASKVVLLQEESVRIISQFLANILPFKGNKVPSLVYWGLKFLSNLCDSGVGSFEDCRHVAASLNLLLKVLPFGKEYERLAEAIQKYSSHRLGRAAFVAIGLGFKIARSPPDLEPSEHETENDDLKEGDESQGEDCEPFMVLTKRLSSAFDADNACNALLLRITRAFASGAVRLTSAGRSFLGLGALKLLFGSDLENTESGHQNAAKAIVHLIDIIDRKNSEGAFEEGFRKVAEQAKDDLRVLLKFLQSPVSKQKLHESIHALIAEAGTSISPEHKISNRLNRFVLAIDDSEYEEEDEVELDYSDFAWECAGDLPRRTALSKRKAFAPSNMSKRQRMGTSAVRGIASSSNKDIFRLRKANGNRPPSVHVDDYMARENGPDSSHGNSPGNSVHVDEFMARQKGRTSEERTSNENAELIDDAGATSYMPLYAEEEEVTASGISTGNCDLSPDFATEAQVHFRQQTVADNPELQDPIIEAARWRNEANLGMQATSYPMVIFPPAAAAAPPQVPSFLPQTPLGTQQAPMTSQHLQLQQQQISQGVQQHHHHLQPQFQPQHLQLHLQQEHYQIQTQVYHHPQPIQQQPQLQSQPQESWSSLQQILASPESIQELVRDQTRLTRLLEQHPKLLSLLQEKFNMAN